MEPEFKDGKEVIVPFSVVVAWENNRGSIISAQAAGRAFRRAFGRASKRVSRSGFGPQQPPAVLGVRYYLPRYIWVPICQDCSGTYLGNLYISGTYLSCTRSGIWVPRYISCGCILIDQSIN